MRFAKPILAVLIVLGIIVLLLVVIIRGFSSNTPAKKIDLVQYANTSAVSSLYIDNLINADLDHRTLKINVSQTEVSVDVIQGYQGTVLRHQSFANNTSSYAIFLQALTNLNFAKGDPDPAKSDERGLCPSGNRYIYQLTNAGNNSFRYWSTSCGQGTFTGQRGGVQLLFRGQIPADAANDLTSDIGF